MQNSGAPPVTVASLVADLQALGVQPGMTLLVHSSLRALGWVCGGPVAVVLALEEALGPTGTLVMPTFSTDLTDPSGWRNPPVPKVWWQTIRETMPAYDPLLTPTRRMGAIPECFRRQHDVLRSAHPQFSFAAWGAQAATLLADHHLPFSLGEQSPLARIYDHEGWVLLLGVGYGNNTSLHLAETRASFPGKREIESAAPVLVEGQRHWLRFADVDYDPSDFVAIGQAFAQATGLERRGRVGNADVILCPQRSLVDFGTTWITYHRKEPRND